MKKAILLILAGIVGGKVTAFADGERAKKLTPLQKQQIAWAMKVLADNKALSVSQNQCLEFDMDILSVLESQGHIERGGSETDTICVGGGAF